MNERDKGFLDDKRDVVNDEVNEQLGGHIRGLIYINAAMLLPIIFWAGVSWQRLNDLDIRTGRMASYDALTQQIGSIGTELNRIRDRVDRLLEDSTARKREK